MALHYLVHTAQVNSFVASYFGQGSWAVQQSASTWCNRAPLLLAALPAIVSGVLSKHIIMARCSVFSHQPPTVLHCQCIRAGVSSWDHDLLGARGHFTYSTGGVLVMKVTCNLILCTVQKGITCIASGWYLVCCV